jgi:hypothetical protein
LNTHEDVVGLDRFAFDQQADDLADVGIFERHQLVTVAVDSGLDISGQRAGRSDRLRSRPDRMGPDCLVAGQALDDHLKRAVARWLDADLGRCGGVEAPKETAVAAFKGARPDQPPVAAPRRHARSPQGRTEKELGPGRVVVDRGGLRLARGEADQKGSAILVQRDRLHLFDDRRDRLRGKRRGKAGNQEKAKARRSASKGDQFCSPRRRSPTPHQKMLELPHLGGRQDRGKGTTSPRFNGLSLTRSHFAKRCMLCHQRAEPTLS